MSKDFIAILKMDRIHIFFFHSDSQILRFSNPQC